MDEGTTFEDRSAEGGSHGTIGPYRLLQKLGEGGMGEVWLAEQTEPVRRRVAIKVIKAGMDTKRVIARFEAERQALALMDHPAIAKVFDAGETPRGLPYFAMEYVKGEPITAYCDREKLTNEDRLRLFSDVCQGVQHAHQKGVIHRDLKPGNVMITLQDGKPVPKIIDFGVAKAVSQRLTEKTLFTEQGVMIGTLEYMSPEQAEMTGLDVDTRTDVYSLGVILYELVTGALPFDAASLRSAGFDEIRRQIREVEPPRPSARVSRAGTASIDSAANRRTQPSQLASRLEGEIDWIVMKAIEKDRARRYASPSEMAADVGRYLADEPVTARAPSTAYRARKFVARHKFGVAAASLAVGGLLAFAVTMAVQAGRIAMERDRAERVSEFLTGLFEAANPAVAQGKTVTARDLLDEGAARIEKELKDQPLVQAELMHTMGVTYKILGLCGEAGRLFRSAVDTRLEQLGPNDSLTLQSMAEVGAALWCSGKTPEAEVAMRQVLERSRDAFGPDNEMTLDAAHILAGILDNLGRFDEAEALSRDTLQRSHRTLGADHILTLGLSADLAFAAEGRDPKEALALVRDLIPRLRATVGEDHPLYVAALAHLQYCLSAVGDTVGSVAAGEDALPRARRVMGDASQFTAEVLENLAKEYSRQGRYEDAGKLADSWIDYQLRAGNPDDTASLGMRELASRIYVRQHRYTEAERLRLEVLAVKRRTLGESHPDIGHALYNLACVTALEGKRAESIDWLRQSVEHGLDYADVLTRITDLTPLYGDPAKEAATLVQDLIPRLRATVGEDHPLYVVALVSLQDRLAAAGDTAGSVAAGEDALARARRVMGDASRLTANALGSLAWGYSVQGRNDVAGKLADSWLDNHRRSGNPEDPQTLYMLEQVSRIYSRQHRYAESERLRLEVLAGKRRALGENHPDLRYTLYNLACVTALEGKRAESLDWLRQSVAHGLHDVDLIVKDTDLVSLHGDPAFDAVVAEARKKVVAAPPGK